MYIFKIHVEFFYKLLYISFLWVIVALIFYYFIEDFLLYLSNILNQYLIIKDFQEIITIYTQITIFLANLLVFFYTAILYLVWKQNVLFKTEKNNYSVFLIVYLFCIVLWIVKQDLFFSNWEIFLNTNKILFDIQPDFYIFFQSFFIDINDFFMITCLLYFFYLIFFTKQLSTNIQKIKEFRFVCYTIYSLYFIYFFSCETILNLLSFILFAFFLTEIIIFTKILLLELKKLVIKSKYF